LVDSGRRQRTASSLFIRKRKANHWPNEGTWLISASLA